MRNTDKEVKEAIMSVISSGGDCELCGLYDAEVPDHCHKTKIWRGALCHKCNIGISLFDDNIELLEKAIAYLRQFGRQWYERQLPEREDDNPTYEGKPFG